MTEHDLDYRRVEKAIGFIDENFRAQPSLAELAAYLGMSPSHTQRLFRRWAGISPKRFLQFASAQHARGALVHPGTTLDAAYATGLSGGGRLHDLMVSIEAMTPGEIKAKGAGVTIWHGATSTPFGKALIAWTDRGICFLSFVEATGVLDAESLRERWPMARHREDLAKASEWAELVFPESPGKRVRPVTLLVQGTNFQIRVWEALLRVPAGRLTSYGRLAQASGYPGASRAAGNAAGQNTIAYLIPCHRVIRATGAFGQYRWGEARKRSILAWEAARMEGDRPR